MDIPALPFCQVTLKTQKPLPSAYLRTLKTLGDHLRKRRLDLKLLQRDVAQKLGVDKASIHNSETNRTSPSLSFIPRLIEFVGHIPFEASFKNLGEKIKTCRQLSGITQKLLAKQLGIDPGTLARWEKGKGKPSKESLQTLFDFSLLFLYVKDRT
jgi:transcriptional regulator with XRE-family HTH domain